MRLKKGQTFICDCGEEMSWHEMYDGVKVYVCGECGEVKKTIVVKTNPEQ